jgi:glycosyltransferase involved in cell wall biosynthesis
MTPSPEEQRGGTRTPSSPTRNTGTDQPPANATALVPLEERPKKIIGRFTNPANGNGRFVPAESTAGRTGQAMGLSTPIALFCHEPPDSYIGGHVAGIAPILARRGSLVHLFCRHPFPIEEPGLTVHVVGATDDGDVVAQAQDFTRRAGNAFLQQFPADQPVRVIGYEWSSAPILSLLRGLRNQQGVLSLHSLERQRSDLSSDIARKIADIEREAIDQSTAVLLHDSATGEVLRHWLPECAGRSVQCRSLFSTENFETGVDAGEIKARYQVGPIDPAIVYVGDLDERYGPDLLIKTMPALLRHHPQARLVIVGEGSMLWPLRVYARYLLLEHAVRLVGHVTGQPMYELVQAADIVAVPSREPTPWWPILAGWAARRPVLATHQAAKSLLEHEKDSVLVYPSENSVVWGAERILNDADLRKSLGEAGRKKLEARFGWNALAEQVEEVFAPATVR